MTVCRTHILWPKDHELWRAIGGKRPLAKEHMAALYQKRAKHYDYKANFYCLIGIREFAYRKIAVEALKLDQGDTVVEIGCGTGLNFRLFRDRVG